MVLWSSERCKHMSLQICPKIKIFRRQLIPSWWIWFVLSAQNDSHPPQTTFFWQEHCLNRSVQQEWRWPSACSASERVHFSTANIHLSTILCSSRLWRGPCSFFVPHTPSLKLAILLHTWHGVTSSKDLRIRLFFFFSPSHWCLWKQKLCWFNVFFLRGSV